MADIEYSVTNHVATILLNRPATKNAFTLEMVETWARSLRAAEADPDVRIVVLKGAGGTFCSGVDLGALADRERTPLSQRTLLTEHVHHVAYAARDLSKPYLAAVSGAAVGAGMDMALMADIRIADESARFSEGYVRVGLVPGDGGCFYLPRIVGVAQALRLLCTGEFVDAAEALAIGLVSKVVPEEQLDSAVTELAAQLAAQPPIAVQMIKRSVYFGMEQDLRTALDTISSHLAVVTSTADSAEALSAFKARRPGVYPGR